MFKNIMCELIVILLTILLLYNTWFSNENIKNSIHIATGIMNEWKQKPIDTIQISKFRSCEEIKFNNLLTYKWPGNLNCCICDGKINSSCTEACESTVQISNEILLKKWKGNYICGSSIKSQHYFGLLKSSDEVCAVRYKNCGILDTLGNYLCVPQTEPCPVNFVNIRKNLDENNFSVEIQNSINKNGQIIIGVSIFENEQACIDHNNQHLSINENPILNKFIQTAAFSTNCSTKVINNEGVKTGVDLSVYFKIDNSLLSDYYRTNQLEIYKILDRESIGLYTKKYRGWKKQCETKVFHNFYNSNPLYEIASIMSYIDEFKAILNALTLTILVLIIFSIFNKINGFLKEQYYIIILAYLIIFTSLLVLFYLAFSISNNFKSYDICSSFFEFISTNSCSDAITNSILTSVSKDYFDLVDNYFNIRALALILFALVIFVLVIPFKSRYDKNNKKFQINNYNKLA